MTTLAIATWHARPQLLEEQIVSYNAAFEDDVVHLINVNADFHDSFWREARDLQVDFKKYSNLYFLETPVRTYYAGVAHAFFIAVQEAIRLNINFDYIYWHTSSDLLIKKGIANYIRNFDVGFGKSHGVDLGYKVDHRGYLLPNFDHPDPSAWLKAISEDPQIAQVLKAMNLPKLHKSRCEGSFFSRQVFFELMYPLTMHVSVSSMASPPKAYPLEEYIFAQCVEFFCQRNVVKRAPHVVSTSAAPKNIATIAEIEKSFKSADKFGIKRFTNELNSDERNLVREYLNLPLIGSNKGSSALAEM